MRSLFLRILLWFLATTAITVVGLVFNRWLALSNAPGRQPPFTRVVPFLLVEARHNYESGGRPALEAFIGRVRQVYEVDAIFADAKGRNLLTGEDHYDLVEAAGEEGSPIRPARGHIIAARRSEDGRYWFFLPIIVPRFGFWALMPQDLWLVAAVLLVCYWLAWRITHPVRRLQAAVERFGGGDLAARAPAAGRDEIGRLAGSFNRMADRIHTLLAAERRLLGDISHELRSPLARLGVAVELARSGEGRDAALDRIEKEAGRLNALVGELLEVTRAEGDPASLRRTEVDLGALVAEIVDINGIEASARGCSIALSRNDPGKLQGDAELLRRAVENVIRNAIRHAPQGTVVEVSVSACSIRVRDYGSGVPEDQLSRIFDPFYRVENDRNRSSGGAGLGLAIARRAVELHHGTIEARNANPGLAVEIRL